MNKSTAMTKRKVALVIARLSFSTCHHWGGKEGIKKKTDRTKFAGSVLKNFRKCLVDVLRICNSGDLGRRCHFGDGGRDVRFLRRDFRDRRDRGD